MMKWYAAMLYANSFARRWNIRCQVYGYKLPHVGWLYNVREARKP